MEEAYKRLDSLETVLNNHNLSLNTIALGQKYLENQQTALMHKLDQVVTSLNDPTQSALGRALSHEINGYANRFEEMLKSQQYDIDMLKKLANQIDGAFSLVKFIGISALLSSFSAIGLVIYQLLGGK